MLNEKRNVTLQAKVKFARHNGTQAPLKVVLLSDFHRERRQSRGKHHFIRVTISFILFLLDKDYLSSHLLLLLCSI